MECARGPSGLSARVVGGISTAALGIKGSGAVRLLSMSNRADGWGWLWVVVDSLLGHH